MSSHRKSENNGGRDLWQLLAPAPVMVRRRSSQAHSSSERTPGILKIVVLGLVAGVAFLLQVARLWDLVP